MGLEVIPQELHDRYTIEEREHACAILATDFPEQFVDILALLDAFELKQSYITAKGGSKSPAAIAIDSFLQGVDPVQQQLERLAKQEGREPPKPRRSNKRKEPKRPPVKPIGDPNGRGWLEKKFDIDIRIDHATESIPVPTHKIDNYKRVGDTLRGVGVEVEWNNKDPFFDRDLNNFRLLRQMGVLSVGVIITRLWELQELFKKLGKGASYGQATTHWGKLIPKVDSGAAGGCPLLLIGMGMACYVDDSPEAEVSR